MRQLKDEKATNKTATTKYSISTAFLLFGALFHFRVSSSNHEAPGQRTLEYSEEATFLEAGWHLWGALLILGAPRHRAAPATGRVVSYSHVVDAVRSEGVVCLVSQGGTVLGYAVVGLRHINDRFFIEGEGVPVKSPVPAVDLQKTRKRTSERPFLPGAQRTQAILTHLSLNFTVWVPRTWKEPKASLAPRWCEPRTLMVQKAYVGSAGKLNLAFIDFPLSYMKKRI